MAYATSTYGALSGTYPHQVAITRPPNRLFLFGVGVAMTVSSFVMVEPAPVDALVLGLLLLGVLSGIIGFRGLKPAAVIPLTIFMLANVVSMYDPINSKRAVWYILVTLYLCFSWVFFVGVLGTYGKRGM